MIQKQVNIIEIEWNGPYQLEDLTDEKVNNANGIYQIYGTHEIHGDNTLLYIGETTRQGFKKRLKQHEKNWLLVQASPVKFYLGRIIIQKNLDKEEIENQIKSVEQVLINFSNPIYNSKGLDHYGTIKNLVVLNFGFRNKIPFETSTLYYESDYWKENWKFA